MAQMLEFSDRDLKITMRNNVKCSRGKVSNLREQQERDGNYRKNQKGFLGIKIYDMNHKEFI